MQIANMIWNIEYIIYKDAECVLNLNLRDV